MPLPLQLILPPKFLLVHKLCHFLFIGARVVLHWYDTLGLESETLEKKTIKN